MRDVENKGNSKTAFIVVPIVVALIGCVGVVASAIIDKLPVPTLSAPTSAPIYIVVTETSVIVPPTLTLASDTPVILPTSPIQPTIMVATSTPESLTCKNALRFVQSFHVGQTISGPATLHPFDGCNEMATQLGLTCVGYWGINISAGNSIVIPETVVLYSGNTLSPPVGTFSIYESDSQVEVTQNFWLANCK